MPYKYLKASKGTKAKRYKLNTSVAIIFKSSLDKKNKIKGTLVNILNDSVSILSFKRKNGLIKIAIKDIETVYRLHKKGRKGLITLMSSFVVLAIAGGLLLSSGIIFGVVFLAISIVGLYVAIPICIANYLADFISKRTIKKGWAFSASN